MKELNEAELLSIKRLRAKKTHESDIADRIGISVKELRTVCFHEKTYYCLVTGGERCRKCKKLLGI